MAAEIAYVVKGFPRLSETFISNEVLLLESMGADIKLFSVKQPSEHVEQREVSHIRSEVDYVPPVTSLSNTTLPNWLYRNIPSFTGVHLQLVRQRPLPYFRTLASVFWITLVCRDRFFSKPKKVFIKEFIQAGYIACRILESGSIRHLHAHFCHGATTIALFVSRLTGLPFSFTAHAKDIYQRNQNPGDLLVKKIRSSSFVATCTGANKSYLDSLGVDSKVHRIYHGLDVSFFKPLQKRYTAATLEILSVGRYVEKKGFRYLLEACSILNNKGYRFHCRIIGEMGDQYRPLRHLVREFGLEPCVSLEGPKAHGDLLPIYQHSSIFALPCHVVADGDRDGIPNVLVEAMACGLAVVSTDISGIPELIRPEYNGLLVGQRDSRSLAAALERLFSEKSLIDRLAKNARNTVCHRFDSRCTTIQLKRLFDEVINGGERAALKQEVISSEYT